MMIWIQFLALLVCFTIAATVSEGSMSKDIREILFIASVVLGMIHLIDELHQFIYDYVYWLKDPWNMIGRDQFINQFVGGRL